VFALAPSDGEDARSAATAARRTEAKDPSLEGLSAFNHLKEITSVPSGCWAARLKQYDVARGDRFLKEITSRNMGIADDVLGFGELFGAEYLIAVG